MLWVRSQCGDSADWRPRGMGVALRLGDSSLGLFWQNEWEFLQSSRRKQSRNSGGARMELSAPSSRLAPALRKCTGIPWQRSTVVWNQCHFCAISFAAASLQPLTMAWSRPSPWQTRSLGTSRARNISQRRAVACWHTRTDELQYPLNHKTILLQSFSQCGKTVRH